MIPKPQFTIASFHLTPTQVTRVLRAAPSDRARAFIRLLAETGIRRAELANLRIEDVRADERILVIRNGKGGKTRLVPMTNSLVDELRALMNARRTGFVFPGRNGSAITVRQINRIVADCGNRAGVAHPDPKRRQLTCHLFRHSFARNWKDAGGSIETLSKLLGHASQATTMDLYGTQGLLDVQRNYASTMKRLATTAASAPVSRPDSLLRSK